MKTTTATYDMPSVWAPLLVEWAVREQRDLLELAEDSRQKGHRKNAASLTAEAGTFVWIADWARCRLLTTDDAEQPTEINPLTGQIINGPPHGLVALTARLRGRLGHWFPWVLPTDWQAIACVLLRGRP